MQMDETTTQPGVQVKKSLWERFRDDVESRRGTVHGNLSHELETAIQEYLNASQGGDTHDRLRRLEEQTEEILTHLDAEDDSDGGTDSVSKTTENRIADIMADIRERSEELGTSRVRESDVEAAIERNAGTSYKTVRRYMKLLQNQREVFPDPNRDHVYFVRETPFIAYIEQNDDVSDDLRERVASEYGWEWWEDHAPDGLVDVDEGRAFQ